MCDILQVIGWCCRHHRMTELGMSQREVGEELGNYSQQSVSDFEHGRVNNAAFFFWYLNHGLDFETVRAKWEEVKRNG